MLANLPVPLDVIAAAKEINATDVSKIRKLVYSDGAISDREAEWVLALNAACPSQCGEWSDFYVEALADFLVHRMEPAGYVTEENAKWLVARLAEDGVVSSGTELELLIKIMEAATSAPSALAAFALNAVKDAVVSGSGMLRNGVSLDTGIVSDADTELLRRILYAFGGGGNAAITRDEAEILFDINDATTGAANSPAWNDLFAKAIASHIMMASGYVPPSREEALRREKWLEDTTINVGGFFSRMVSSLGEIFRVKSDEQTGRDAVIDAAEQVDAGEAEWIASRIDRDGKLSDAERAVLAFIKRESPEVHPALRPLLEKVA